MMLLDGKGDESRRDRALAFQLEPSAAESVGQALRSHDS